jgi:hypothetical protein
LRILRIDLGEHEDQESEYRSKVPATLKLSREFRVYNGSADTGVRALITIWDDSTIREAAEFRPAKHFNIKNSYLALFQPEGDDSPEVIAIEMALGLANEMLEAYDLG